MGEGSNVLHRYCAWFSFFILLQTGSEKDTDTDMFNSSHTDTDTDTDTDNDRDRDLTNKDKEVARLKAAKEEERKRTENKPANKKRIWAKVSPTKNRTKYLNHKAKMERLGKWFICPEPGCEFVSIACN
jgi:hypothetical protein